MHLQMQEAKASQPNKVIMVSFLDLLVPYKCNQRPLSDETNWNQSSDLTQLVAFSMRQIFEFIVLLLLQYKDTSQVIPP